jgi:hypothetical protein
MLVIGNGESRTNLDIDSLNLPTVGCNAIFRDRKVDHLVCCDKRMVREALNHPNTQQSCVYTRHDWNEDFGVFPVPDVPYVGKLRQDDPWHWGTGQYAILVAVNYSATQLIHIVGFDLFGIEGYVNNVYKDTKSYDVSSKREVDPSYWIYQNQKIFECYNKHTFNYYVEENFPTPEQWKKIPNLKIIPLTDLEKNIII